MPKTRLDLLLLERGLAESRAKAQAVIMAGQVRVDGQVVDRSASNVANDANITLDQGPRFVSRGGDKLEAALTGFPVEAADRVCADVGASTGGFTDCLLQHGAAKVYAIDVGKGLLHWKLRNDSRVVVMEETNARFLERLPEAVSLVTIDVSFISLRVLLPVVINWFSFSLPASYSEESEKEEVRRDVIALIKPQFEAGRKEAARHKGVIRDPAVHKAVLTDVLTFAEAEGYDVRGLRRCPVLGPKGNVEFLAWLEVGGRRDADLAALVEQVLE
jgi:23S rRNA (cytidine1920-2'-O)/16S rRNA (cytidine1409-2'-O)-methyltransferase